MIARRAPLRWADPLSASRSAHASSRRPPASRGRAGLRARSSGAVAEKGQASVELLGAVPALLLLALVALQALAVGYASVLAASAAEAGALRLAAGRDPRAAVREALPGWSRARARVRVSGAHVRVVLEPPSPLRGLSRRLEVTGKAAVGSVPAPAAAAAAFREPPRSRAQRLPAEGASSTDGRGR